MSKRIFDMSPKEAFEFSRNLTKNKNDPDYKRKKEFVNSFWKERRAVSNISIYERHYPKSIIVKKPTLVGEE